MSGRRQCGARPAAAAVGSTARGVHGLGIMTADRSEEPLPGTIPPRREYRCPVCGAEFVSRQQLDDHDRAEHRTP